MRIPRLLLAGLLAVTAATAQRHRLAPAATDTPEGQLLAQIASESDDSKKLPLIEEFTAKYPKHENAVWAYEQLVDAYGKTAQYDKVLDAGAKLLAIDPADLVTAYTCLQAAEGKKDPELILKWSDTASQYCHKVAESQKPADESEAEEWARRVDYAKQLDLRTEYALFAAAAQSTDPKVKLALGDALEQRNPQSQYLAQVDEQRFLAYMQQNQGAKAVALAEKSIARGQGSPEMMLAVAEHARSGQHWDQSLALAKKALATAEAKPKPEGVADADWQTWRSQIVSRAHWVAGLSYAGQTTWRHADQELRTALPGVGANRDMLAEALFQLGVANYRLAAAGDTERARDALKYSEQCAAIPGRFQAPARTNVKAIQAQYRIR